MLAQTDRPPSGNLDAYSAYLQGIFYGARGDRGRSLKAVAHFTKAIELDPRLRARVGRPFDGMDGLRAAVPRRRRRAAGLRRSAQGRRQGRPAAARSCRRVCRARDLARNADFDWAGAEADSRRAVSSHRPTAARSSRSAFRWRRSAAGRSDPAHAQAIEINPLRATVAEWLSTYLSSLGRLDEAEAAIRKSLSLDPTGSGYYELLTIIQIQRGDAAAALAAAQREPEGSWQDIALALALQIGSDRAAADAALQTLIDKDADVGADQIAESMRCAAMPTRRSSGSIARGPAATPASTVCCSILHPAVSRRSTVCGVLQEGGVSDRDGGEGVAVKQRLARLTRRRSHPQRSFPRTRRDRRDRSADANVRRDPGCRSGWG